MDGWNKSKSKVITPTVLKINPTFLHMILYIVIAFQHVQQKQDAYQIQIMLTEKISTARWEKEIIVIREVSMIKNFQ